MILFLKVLILGNCLSAAQLATLGYMYGPVTYDYPLANGEQMYPGWGSGMENIGGWIFSATQPVAGDPAFGAGPGAKNVRTYYCQCLGGSFSVLSINLQKWQQKIQQDSSLFDVSENISQWIAHGGKLIMITNASDAISNPRAQMMLYDRWVARYGRDTVDQHVRYYVDPNQGHVGVIGVDASGTSLPSRIDAQGMLESWVEHGTTPPAAPTAVSMARTAPYQVTYSKPVCLFPAYPKYTGTGSTKVASSYTCSTPLTDLAGQITGYRLRPALSAELEHAVTRISDSLNDTRAACTAVNRLAATVLDAASGGQPGLTVAQASAIVTSVSAEQWAVGCLTTSPSDAAEQQLLNLVGALDKLSAAPTALNGLRGAVRAAGDSLADIPFTLNGVVPSSYTHGVCGSLQQVGTAITASGQQATALQSDLRAVQKTETCG
jgi:hypothetical protein